jgi:hypothetical protein
MGDFFKLNWKKFILPVILIIIFLVVINALRISGSIGDKYDCQVVTLIQKNIDNAQKNDTAAVNQVDSEMKLLAQNKQKEVKHLQYSESISAFVKIINPIVPFPCENLGKSNVCQFYINKETYDCLKKLDINGDIFSQPKMSVYKPVSLWIILLNVLLLFIEGYFVSSIIMFFYGKIRDKQVISSGMPSDSSAPSFSYTLPPSA